MSSMSVQSAHVSMQQELKTHQPKTKELMNLETKELINLKTQKTAKPPQHRCKGQTALLQSPVSNTAKALQ
uniref:Uncharacterized protein n=1 Tax=Prevotella sp. GTC17260 TaxID=3236796 RepID=A0AB33JAE0_9BACT